MLLTVGHWRGRKTLLLALCALMLLILFAFFWYSVSPEHTGQTAGLHESKEALDDAKQVVVAAVGLSKRERALAEYLQTVCLAHDSAGDDTIRSFQKDRQSHIDKVCHARQRGVRSWKDLSPLHKRNLLSHLLVSDKHRFLYCSTPKVACANWKKILKVLDGKAIHPNDGVLNHVKDVKFLRDYSEDEIEERLNTYYKFTFVREPISRLVSAFLNKFREIPVFQRRFGVGIISKYRANPPLQSNGDDVTFEEFVRYLLDKSPPTYNEHWMPYEHLCQPCLVKYDFVGAYENLQAEANYVLRQVNASHRVAFPAPQSYYKTVSAKKKLRLFNTLSTVQKEQLLNIYSQDYATFNYDLPET